VGVQTRLKPRLCEWSFGETPGWRQLFWSVERCLNRPRQTLS
jgi:hypothetical protein